MEAEHICSGTDCQSRSIGSIQELKEIPAWRHPTERKGCQTFEVVATVFYCEKHEEEAKSVPLSVLPR
jgi:hypothetical protein